MDVQVTVKNIVNPAEDYFIVSLEPLEKFTWEAGDFAIFELGGEELERGNKRAFSIASNVEDNIIRIGFRTTKNISPYKDKLIHTKVGDTLMMKGPKGKFHIRDRETPIIFMAGGVGITPIIALLEKIQKEEGRDIVLLYSSQNYFLFLDEIENYAKSNKKISIIKCSSIEETQENISKLIEKYKEKAYYYISGPGGFVDFASSKLESENIEKNRVIKDKFIGY